MVTPVSFIVSKENQFFFTEKGYVSERGMDYSSQKGYG
jgi:hypothetical protein